MTERWSAFEHAAMGRALALAAQGRTSTQPNPRVGCVIARGEQIIAGQLKIGMSATKQFWKQQFKSIINVFEGVTESSSRFLINLSYSAFKRR